MESNRIDDLILFDRQVVTHGVPHFIYMNQSFQEGYTQNVDDMVQFIHQARM